jgi:hypothetical protein
MVEQQNAIRLVLSDDSEDSDDENIIFTISTPTVSEEK